jgi:hypothetical protein
VRDDLAPGLGGLFAAGPHAGNRAPDGTAARAADGAPVRLYELTPGTRHTVFLFSGRRGTPDDGRRGVQERIENEYSDVVAAYRVDRGEHSEGRDTGALLDPSGELHRVYGAEEEKIYLIRPDGYVGYRGRAVNAAGLFQYLHSLFVPIAAGAATPPGRGIPSGPSGTLLRRW